MEGDCSFSFFYFFYVLFLSVKEKEPKRKLRNPPGLARRARPSAERTFPAKIILRGFFIKSPAGKKWKTDDEDGCPIVCVHPSSPIRFLFFGSFFSFPERKERTERREKQKAHAGGGPPDGARSSPSPLRFLFFGSFFSFPERKERTEKKEEQKKEKTEKESAVKSQARAGGAGLWAMRPPVCGMRPLTR